MSTTVTKHGLILHFYNPNGSDFWPNLPYIDYLISEELYMLKSAKVIDGVQDRGFKMKEIQRRDMQEINLPGTSMVVSINSFNTPAEVSEFYFKLKNPNATWSYEEQTMFRGKVDTWNISDIFKYIFQWCTENNVVIMATCSTAVLDKVTGLPVSVDSDNVEIIDGEDFYNYSPVVEEIE
jgi:hypothetical protein